MRELRTSLKELRMEAGFTQSELAEIVGNCRDNISRLERNKFKNPTYQLLYDIAKYFLLKNSIDSDSLPIYYCSSKNLSNTQKKLTW